MDNKKPEYIEWAQWLWDMLVEKQAGLKVHGSKIVNLCFMGSLCVYGLNPEVFDDFTYNFGTNNQDLFCAYHVLKKHLSYIPNCKNIILFYSYFLNGFDLSKTDYRWRCYYYKKILDVPYDIEASNVSDFPQEIKCNIDLSNYQGYRDLGLDDDGHVKDLANGHLKNFYRHNSNLIYLEKICELCKKHHIKLHIVIPPCRPDYIALTPKNEITNSILELRKIIPSKYIYNFFEDADFNYRDFCDAIHLNKDGATLLSRKINNILRKQKKYNIFKCFSNHKPFFNNNVVYYDTIISLGGNCAAAIQLDFRKLRKYSLPFDYLSMRKDQAIKYLLNGFKNKFSDFFLRENMVELVGDERGDDRHNCVQYKDTLSGYRCIHAFKEHIENNVEHYNEIMSMFRRRFDRMFEKIENSDRIAFILATSFGFDLGLLKPLQEYLSKKYPHKTIDWYIVQFGCSKNDARIFTTRTGVMYFYSYNRAYNLDDFTKKDLREWAFMDNFTTSKEV